MIITRQTLIEYCDRFLNDMIEKKDIQGFACEAISSGSCEWLDDDIVSEIIFEWDNEDINFEINKTNIRLWKNRLLNSQDNLMAYNYWNSHIEEQKIICGRYSSVWKPINKKLRVGISANVDKDPIYGLRLPSVGRTTGWYIWTGDYSEADDFFEPMCAEHLLQVRPEIIKYLGLDVGYRFISDKEGYEDIWYDEKLKSI